jgi:predicted DNA-binding transcriptional regulator AlpA
MSAGQEYLRLAQIVGRKAGPRTVAVVGLLPISASTWWAGVRAGKFPAPVKLGPRISVWRRGEIEALLEVLP